MNDATLLLLADQLEEDAFPPQQLFVCASLDHATAFHANYFIRVSNRAEPVSDDDGGLSAHQRHFLL